MGSFVHLHVFSDYSLLKGMCRIGSLVEKTLASGMDAVALTDQGNMFGILEFSLECAGNKWAVNPVLGVEAYVAPRGHKDPSNESPLGNEPFPLVLLCENPKGYENLCRLVSLSYKEGFSAKPRIDFELLSVFKEGLIVLSGGPQSEVSLMVARGDDKGAARTAARYRDLLGADHYYLELTDHSLPEEKAINQGLIALGKELGIPLVATNQVHYLETDEAYAHEILWCIESKASIYQEKGVGRDKRAALPGSGWHFATAEEMTARFSHVPEALSNTVAIAARCQVRLGKDKPHMAVVDVPEGRTHLEHLRAECLNRLPGKIGEVTEAYLKQLEFELAVIEKMGFPSYFLIVGDFVNEAKKRGILVGPGRGSAAGSLVSFAMGITNLDPLKHGLLFERFLNPERVNLPDIDMDFQDTRREEVIAYIRERFGHDKVCQIVTYGKLKAKAILKDVARVFGVEFGAANKLSALIPADPKMTLEKAWQTSAEFKEAILSQPRYQEVYRHALKLEGLTRQVGVHAAGVIIADKSIDQYVPQYVADGVTVTQYEGSVLEDACGLIKMDILGLATLSILDESMKLIQAHHGVSIDLDRLPFDDLKTFSIFARGKTHGIFQFESEGMRKNLIELKPNTLDDLVAMNAMYRPGPMSWIPVYIAKKHGRVPDFKDPGDQANYVSLEALVGRTPSLQKILGPTNLIPIYQEQIMEIGREYAGFSLGEADMMRRAMGKKKADILEEYKAKFVEMGKGRGHAPEDSVFLFEKIILPFAGYGFNKSHAACYAVVAYQTAYLKANYPECFMTALLNNEIEDTDKIREYVDEARSLGLTVVPPDINKSGLTFRIDGGRIRYGLAAVKGVGQAAGSALLAERDKAGAFASLADFRQRLNEGKTNKQVVEQLIRAGAFDTLGLDAAQLFHVLPELEKRIGAESALTAGGQTSLFETVAATAGDGHEDLLAKGRSHRSDPEELKNLEKEGLGFNLKRDPLAVHGRFLLALSTLSPHMELDASDFRGKPGVFAGVLVSMKKILTRKNEEMVFATVENPAGRMECTFFSEAWRSCQGKTGKDGKVLLTAGGLVLIKGKAKLRDGKAQVLAEDVLPFDPEKVPKSAYRELHVRFNRPLLSAAELDGLHAVLHDHWGGTCGVVLHFPQEGNSDIRMKAGAALTVHVDATLEGRVKNLAFVERSWFR